MNDIDKLMDKLKKTRKPKETPKKEEKEEKTDPKEMMDDTNILEEEGAEAKQQIVPAETKDAEETIDQEVAVLQNDGIFRRELILNFRELIDVFKINTQTLLDLKKLLEGDNGKGK